MEGLIRRYKLSLIYDDIQLSDIERVIITYIDTEFKNLTTKIRIDETFYYSIENEVVLSMYNDEQIYLNKSLWLWLLGLLEDSDQICYLIKDVVLYYLDIETEVHNIWYRKF